MTYRQYLCDADFLVLLEVGESVAVDLENNLSDPTWGVWLGRKSCVPSAPVFAGIYSSLEEVSAILLSGKSIDCFTYQKEVPTFEQGTDTIMDKPICYAIDKREMGQRRVKIFEAR